MNDKIIDSSKKNSRHPNEQQKNTTTMNNFDSKDYIDAKITHSSSPRDNQKAKTMRISLMKKKIEECGDQEINMT